MIPFIHPTLDINGTCLQGYITITLVDLLKTLGEPTRCDLDKVTVEWSFKTHDGVVFTIYDYKEDVTPTRSYDWHVGGLDKNVLALVQKLFPNHTVRGNR